jgi:hypothetical protein
MGQAMAKPTPRLMQEAERVLHYLNRTRDLGLTFEPSNVPLHGYSDSDWSTRRSTSGHVFRLSQASISWSSKRQPTVALSSCEAEIMAASEAAKEAIHLDGMAQFLGLKSGESPLDVYVDNSAAIDVAYNPEHHGRMKHVERRHFFIRECVEDHKIRVPFVRSAANLADFFTKAMPSSTFFTMRDIIMNVPRAWGGVENRASAKPIASPVRGGGALGHETSGPAESSSPG